jgi:ubiquinone/menaquinone biosynthesis C-methylase UbiE
MTFETAPESYDRFMGRFSRRLAPLFADFAGVDAGMAVLDVGCGPGALTEELARRLGGDRVAAADPSEPFVEGCRRRVPEADVRLAPAEQLPWDDDRFDAALSQLAVNFMADAPAAARELGRVLRPGGTAAACTWEQDGMQMLTSFWDAAKAVAPDAPKGEQAARYRSEEELRGLWRDAGFGEVVSAKLEVSFTYERFEDFWQPYTAGVGPAGAFLVGLPEETREAIREEARRRMGDGPFELRGIACAVRGTA